MKIRDKLAEFIMNLFEFQEAISQF